ncbi:hypothetical protein QYE76_015017 [Lolium multiflorum]|uniref:CCHC-type domain-containing protein n=1 Tax=Lolium multiflorum TaxID=4521 RepID=A0AAD8U1S2_LOLMU|nr:hypothetical protein QYE76_015017 [Lolium multiflorum]
MAAIRCSGAGRMLLRRAPGLLRQAALVGEQGVLHRQPIRALAPSSNRYIASYLGGLLDSEKKRLATDLMKERSPDNEIENLDELLNLMSFKYACSDQHKIQAEAARRAIQDKKLELVSLLLRPDSGDEYKEKMKELADVARRHRESLVLEKTNRVLDGRVTVSQFGSLPDRGLSVTDSKRCAAIVAYSIPRADVHRRTGEQVSGTARPCDPVRERAGRVLGSALRLLKLFITGRLPSKSGGAAYRRLQRRLLRPVVPVVNNVVINNVTAATSSATPPPPPPPDRELYIMESFHDIRMVNNRSVVEQAHEIRCIAKELELLKCALPDKFVAGCIIAKLPPSWRNFATTLKHKRQEISVENLIASLDVEEKARAKDTTEKGEGQSSANMVQKKPYSKNKGNNKPSFNKPMKTTTFKKKKMINKADLSCFTCGETGHFSKDCPERADRKKKARQVNTVTASNADGYGRSGFLRLNGEWVTCFFVVLAR